jgi:hypothetical protein
MGLALQNVLLHGAMVRRRVMLQTMLCPSKPHPLPTVQTVCGGAPVMAHNMITTITTTAA